MPSEEIKIYDPQTDCNNWLPRPALNCLHHILSLLVLINHSIGNVNTSKTSNSPNKIIMRPLIIIIHTATHLWNYIVGSSLGRAEKAANINCDLARQLTRRNISNNILTAER